MKEFYLRYEQSGEKDGRHLEVSISICTNSIHDLAIDKKNKYDFEDRINAEGSARSLLNQLTRQIKVKTGLDYSWEDALKQDTEQDNLPRFKNFKRHITFDKRHVAISLVDLRFSEAGAAAQVEAERYNNSLHDKVFPVYRKFVLSHSPLGYSSYSESRR